MGVGRLTAGRDPWNDSRTGDFLWTNTNVGEAIPGVLTPVSWSFAEVFLRATMARAAVGSLRGWGRIGGRVYLNVSVMRSLSGAAGLGERAFRRLTAEIFGRLPEKTVIPPLPADPVVRLRGAATLIGHVLGELTCTARRREPFLTGHPGRCERRRAEIAAADSPGALARLGSEALAPEFHRVCWVLAATTRAAGAWFVGTRLLLRPLVGDAGANALTSGLAGGGPLASLGLLEGLDQLAAGRIDRDTFARRHGHRGPREFELAAPRPGEDPAWLNAQRADPDRPGYRDLLAAAGRQRADAWTDLGRRHRRLAPLLRRAEAVWARTARDRERARDEVGRYLGVLRAYVLRAGELTGLGEDIFFLDAEEVVRVLRGRAVGAGLVADRRAAYVGYAALPPYPSLIRGRFDPYADAADPVGSAASGERPRVTGFPGSAGIVVGVVRVLTDVADAGRLRPGEVLVTPVTNVGWTPLFPRLAAVVTDVGAPLSHAAIVARELGIPAVVGCGDATTRLRTGDRVRVDGAAGTVEVLG
jgi:phosphohistidine swiveling domain-containing protein